MIARRSAPAPSARRSPWRSAGGGPRGHALGPRRGAMARPSGAAHGAPARRRPAAGARGARPTPRRSRGPRRAPRRSPPRPRGFLADQAGAARRQPLVACGKGIDLGTLGLQPRSRRRWRRAATLAALTGPSFAADIARGLPTALTLACADRTRAGAAGRPLDAGACGSTAPTTSWGPSSAARSRTSSPSPAAPLGAAASASRRGRRCSRAASPRCAAWRWPGARAETLAGLSGLGDLVADRDSAESRNFRSASRSGAASRGPGVTVEGAATARAACASGGGSGSTCRSTRPRRRRRWSRARMTRRRARCEALLDRPLRTNGGRIGDAPTGSSSPSPRPGLGRPGRAGRRRPEWHGVRNYQARNHMRAMQPGDLGFFYHSGNSEGGRRHRRGHRPGAPRLRPPTTRAGTASTSARCAPFPRPVTLEAIQAEPRLAEMVLVRNTRLSVQPVTAEEWRMICALGGTRADGPVVHAWTNGHLLGVIVAAYRR